MPDPDPCRRALTPTEESALFAGDALRAAGRVMSGAAADATDAAYLAVYAILAAAALGQGAQILRGVGRADTLGVNPENE